MWDSRLISRPWSPVWGGRSSVYRRPVRVAANGKGAIKRVSDRRASPRRAPSMPGLPTAPLAPRLLPSAQTQRLSSPSPSLQPKPQLKGEQPRIRGHCAHAPSRMLLPSSPASGPPRSVRTTENSARGGRWFACGVGRTEAQQRRLRNPAPLRLLVQQRRAGARPPDHRIVAQLRLQGRRHRRRQRDRRSDSRGGLHACTATPGAVSSGRRFVLAAGGVRCVPRMSSGAESCASRRV